MKKRILSILLATVTLFGMISFSAQISFAAEPKATTNYSAQVALNGYSLGANVADAYVSYSSDTVELFDFNDDGKFFCIFEDDGTGQSDWSSTVTKFEANKDYWLVIALAKQGGDALPETDLNADNITLTNGFTEKYSVYDDDLWWIEFKLNRLSDTAPSVYNVTFDANGGSVSPESATTGNDGKLTSLPTPTHTNSYMKFDGWYTGKSGNTQVTTDTVFTFDTTVYARWVADYTIEVTLNGYEAGKKVADTTLTENSDTIDIDRENCHIFTEKDGVPDWSSEVTEFEANVEYWLVIALTKQGGDELTITDLIANDVDLTNDYTAELLDYDDGLWWVSYKLKPLDTSVPTTTHTVTFDSDGGSAVTAQTVESGKTATKPADPTKEGYTFKGWYLGENAYDFSSPVTEPITLKAKWEAVSTEPEHTCDIKPVAKDEPSCTEGGKEAYYKCEGCGKFYEDALGTKEITDLANWGNLEKLGHTESDWKSDKDNHWKECTVAGCGVTLSDSKAAHKDDNKDGKCDVCEYNVGVDGGDKPSDNPPTGDNSMIWLWIALLFVSVAGVVATTAARSKKKKQ